MKCPKCNTGKLFGDTYNYTTNVIKCMNCGLAHYVGDSKESLKRQISGQVPRETEARKALLVRS